MAELSLALQSHTTSKIASLDDLRDPKIAAVFDRVIGVDLSLESRERPGR